MRELELTIGALLSIEQGDIPRLAALLTDDMVFCGPVPEPLSRLQYLTLISALRAGIPDWKFHFYDVRVEGRFVSMNTRLTGTHSRLMPGFMPGMPSQVPTGRKFQLPVERIEFALEGDLIARIHVDPVTGGGVAGMMEQLGILIPASN
jgi:hypothetical protein